ncbi:MAG: class I SAM-dependent methyltransferase [Clostridiales bacterium]
MDNFDSKNRFTSRAEDYAKYRCEYPKEIVGYLKETISFTGDHVVADVGSGTGILTKYFIESGNQVYAIEPNKEMRERAEKSFSACKNFYSVNGSSENTKLSKEKIDIIISAQAFHWFDPILTKLEFAKILKPKGYVIILWNNIKNVSDGFMSEYKQIKDNYKKNLMLEPIEDKISEFFKPNEVIKKTFENKVFFNFERLIGEIISHSYMPNQSHPKFDLMKEDLYYLFDKYNENGKVDFEYTTYVRCCRFK